MQVAERSKLVDVLQARKNCFSGDFLFDRLPTSKNNFQMTTSWCIPLYTFLHAIGICKAQKTLIEAFEPMRTFAKGVIAQAQPNKEGNFIEQHMEEIKGAKPGSRLYTLHRGSNETWEKT